MLQIVIAREMVYAMEINVLLIIENNVKEALNVISIKNAKMEYAIGQVDIKAVLMIHNVVDNFANLDYVKVNGE